MQKQENNIDIISIMERTLNFIDVRLFNHGRRVAYIVYQILEGFGGYSEGAIRDICLAALLHDIGAYKTEEVDQMVRFETEKALEHSIYGYLFFKYFSPLKHLASAILHHHTACKDLAPDDPLREIAQVFFIADRMDILHLAGIDNRDDLYVQLRNHRDDLFCPDILDRVFECDLTLPVTDSMVEGDCEINRVLHGAPLKDGEILAYLKMIVLFIDFRSHQTLTHTISTASISDSLAGILGIGDEDRRKLVMGSWLHDIGKTGVALHILEKPESLTPGEMHTVQQHVRITDEILEGNVLDEVRRIAAHHHEKLDGSGYPGGLVASELSILERIAVVSDIFSALCGVRSYKVAFPKEQVLSILTTMAQEGLLDTTVVEAAITHYDEITQNLREAVRPFEENFASIKQEFVALRKELAK